MERRTAAKLKKHSILASSVVDRRNHANLFLSGRYYVSLTGSPITRKYSTSLTWKKAVMSVTMLLSLSSA